VPQVVQPDRRQTGLVGQAAEGPREPVWGHRVAELATLGDYIRALGGELKVIADFGDSWRRVA
jgi:hypothetical protein